MIDWWSVLTNLLWILGCAMALAVFSHTDWRVSARGEGERKAVKRTVQDPGLSIGMLLVCLGAGLGAPRWPERVVWFVLAAGWMLWTAWACLNRRRATSC